MKQVRVYNLENHTAADIPESELAPGMVSAKIEGVGDVYIVADQIQRSTDTHELPPGFEVPARATFDLLAPCIHWCRDATDWITIFKGDLHPVRELMVWMWAAAVYHKLTHDGKDPLDVRRDVFGVVVEAMNNGDQARYTIEPKRISRARALTVIDAYRKGNNNPRPFVEFWNDRVDLDALTEMRNKEEATS